MIRILFLIHDLGQGGAEKVLVNLVNNLDRSKFDISVTVLFGGGVNEQFLKPDIQFHAVFPKEVPGNSKLMKLLTPEQLHRLCVKEHYEIEVSYLEGPSARVISGCTDNSTKLVCWIHRTFHSLREATASFRTSSEALSCYQRFHHIICVSRGIQESFQTLLFPVCKVSVLYNTIESDDILQKSHQPIAAELFSPKEFKLIAVGSLKKVKGFDRLIRIHERLYKAGYPVHTYILGKGPDKESLINQAKKSGVEKTITFLGYDTNPYRFVAKCDLFICSSHSEGFSTAATEALIVGTPVCTVEVSGMKELLGENNEYGIVTDNNEDALYHGIKLLLDSPVLLKQYKEKAIERGKNFQTDVTVQAVQQLFKTLLQKE